ncbi:MAG: glycosyltransferase family 4 protein [Vicinamibacterales bacterium]
MVFPVNAVTRSVARHILLLSEWFPPAVGGSGELLANVYSRLSTSAVDVITAKMTGGLGDDSQNARLRTTRSEFPARPGLLSISGIGTHLRLIRAARKVARHDTVLHCGRALPEGSVAWLWRHHSGPNYLCWTHGEELTYAAQSRELSWLQRRVHGRAAALIANSHNTAGLLRTLGNPTDKVHVVHPGVDGNKFRPGIGRDAIRSLLLREGELLLLSVGRLQTRKGHDLVIRALPHILGSSPSLRYVIVGEGPEASRLKALVAELGLTNRVSFAGPVPADKLPAYYAAADIFVHPNRMDGSEFEGFGLVFLEAAAAGLAAIGGRSGGVPEAVEHGRTGLLVGGDDVGELAATIQLLAQSRALREQLGSAARARVLMDFTWDSAAHKVEQIDAELRQHASTACVT